MRKSIDHKEIVQFIFDQINSGQPDDTILEELKSKFLIAEDISEWAIEMARTGFFRAGFKKAGKPYPKSNIDNDPFLKHSIELALHQIEKKGS